MADVFSRQTRSYNMSRIRSKDTKVEELVRKFLFSKGLRYRKNDRRYPGKPDIVIPKYKTVVFVNGCFWHMHEEYPCFVMPKSNTDFWVSKLKRNKERDNFQTKQLESAGWRVLVVWECELKPAVRGKTLEKLYIGITE